MSRVRTDPLVAALTHPTRQGAYQTLSQRDEMSTVQLQEALEVDRYNLYHHLKRLVKVGLIENHRDVGRARWWRVIKQVVQKLAQEYKIPLDLPWNFLPGKLILVGTKRDSDE